GLALHLRHKLCMHFDQIIQQPFSRVTQKCGSQGIALVWGKVLQLLDIVGLHRRTEPPEQFRAHTRMLERGQVEGAELTIPLQIGGHSALWADSSTSTP